MFDACLQCSRNILFAKLSLISPVIIALCSFASRQCSANVQPIHIRKREREKQGEICPISLSLSLTLSLSLLVPLIIVHCCWNSDITRLLVRHILHLDGDHWSSPMHLVICRYLPEVLVTNQTPPIRLVTTVI